MKKLATATAALALATMMSAGVSNQAKADGGAIAIGVGAYLIVDAIVGEKCKRHDWPLNIPAKIADKLRGKPYCHHYGHKDDHHHHERKYK